MRSPERDFADLISGTSLIVGYEDMHLAIAGKLNAHEVVAGKMGAVFRLRAEFVGNRAMPMTDLLFVLEKTAQENHLDVFYDGSGMPIGYWIWAFTESMDVSKRGDCWLSSNVGANRETGIYIIDFAIKRGFIKEILMYLFCSMLVKPLFVKYSKRRIAPKFCIWDPKKLHSLAAFIRRPLIAVDQP